MNGDGTPGGTSWTAEALEAFIAERVAEWLGVSPAEVDRRLPFSEYPLDSVALMSISGDLEKRLRRRLPPTLLLEYTNIQQLARHLAGV